MVRWSGGRSSEVEAGGMDDVLAEVALVSALIDH